MSSSVVRLSSVAESADDIARAWLEYGIEYAKYPSLWRDVAFASGPLRPEGATLRDYSGKTGGAVWSVGAGDGPKYAQASVRGKGFWAGSYDGANDYATLPSLDFIDGTTNFSFVSWVKRTVAGNVRGNIFSLQGQRRIEIRYRDEAVAANAKWEVYYDVGGAKYATGTQTILNQWTHVSAVYSVASGMSLYQNGSVTATNVARGTIEVGFGPVNGLGGQPIDSRYFEGQISGSMIYRRVLTPNEIAILATHPLAAYEVEVPKYWSFNYRSRSARLPWYSF